MSLKKFDVVQVENLDDGQVVRAYQYCFADVLHEYTGLMFARVKSEREAELLCAQVWSALGFEGRSAWADVAGCTVQAGLVPAVEWFDSSLRTRCNMIIAAVEVCRRVHEIVQDRGEDWQSDVMRECLKSALLDGVLV